MNFLLPLVLLAAGASEPPLDPDASVVRAIENARSLTVARAQVDRERHAAERIDLNDVRLGLDHFGVSQLVTPPDANANASPLDNAQIALSWRPPRLDEFGLAQSIAAARVDVAALQLESDERAIAAETRLLHAHILLLREERAIAQEALVQLQTIKDTTGVKLGGGNATQVELSLAIMDVLDGQLELDEIGARVARAEARFARLVGIDDDTAPVALGGDVPVCQPPPDAEATLALARKQSPRLQAIDLERAALERESLRKALRPVPWIDRLRVGYLSHRPVDGRDELHIGVDVDVPLFALLDGFGSSPDGVALRRAKLEAEALEAEDDLESDVASVVLRQRSAAALYQEHAKATATVVADSTSAVDAALASGGADAVGAAVVHGRALKSRRAHVRARERCVEAVIDLWRTTGEVIRTPPASR